MRIHTYYFNRTNFRSREKIQKIHAALKLKFKIRILAITARSDYSYGYFG